MSTPPPGDKDVLGSLPHTRPGRSTARREAARAKRTGATKPAATKPAASKRAAPERPVVAAVTSKPATEPTVATTEAKPAPDAKPKRPAKIPAPVAKAAKAESRAAATRKAAAKKPRRGESAAGRRPQPVPPAGWAVPAEGHGSADPAGALARLADAGAGILRGLLGRLPGQ